MVYIQVSTKVFTPKINTSPSCQMSGTPLKQQEPQTGFEFYEKKATTKVWLQHSQFLLLSSSVCVCYH